MLLGLMSHKELQKCFDLYPPDGATAFNTADGECFFTGEDAKLKPDVVHCS